MLARELSSAATPACCALGLAMALATEGTAQADPERSGRTSALSWVRLPGAEGCVGAPKLAEAVEARLGRRVFVPPSDAEISVEGTVAYRPETRRFTATFRVADRDGAVLGVRDVEESVASCDKLDDRLAFVLSVLIDPDAALGPPSAPTAEATPLPPPAPAPPAAEAPPPPPPAAPTSASEPWRWLAGADFAGAGGLVPDVGWVVSLGALLTPPRWPGLRVKGSSFLPSSRRVEGLARAEIALVSAQAEVCPVALRRPPFGLTGCVGGMVGELSARGSGFPDSRAYGTVLGGMVLELVSELAVTRALRVTLSPSVVVPLSRARLAYDDAAGERRTIFDVAPVGGSLALGLALGSR